MSVSKPNSAPGMGATTSNSKPARAPKAKPVSKGGRLGQGDTIERQQEIVLMHDVDHLTFAQIAERVGMDEKSVREAYHRYVREVAPLLNRMANHDKVAAHLRQLEQIQQELWRTVAIADNSSSAVGGLRVLLEVVKTDIQLRQSLGLLPVAPRSVRDEEEKAWIGQQLAQLLDDVGAPSEALDRLEQILTRTSKED